MRKQTEREKEYIKLFNQKFKSTSFRKDYERMSNLWVEMTEEERKGVNKYFITNNMIA